MQSALLIVGPLCAILGVIVGGFLGARGQIRQQAFVYYLAIEKSREDACVQLLSAVRQFRRYVMYSDVTTEVVAASDHSKGTTIISGRAEYDNKVDEAYMRIWIVARSPLIIEEAFSLTKRLTRFVALRAHYGKGMIPTEIVRDFQKAERRFARVARSELDLAAASLPRPVYRMFRRTLLSWPWPTHLSDSGQMGEASQT